MVADGELTLVDEMIASRAYAGSFYILFGALANKSLAGNLLKKRLLLGNGSTSNGAHTPGQHRLEKLCKFCMYKSLTFEPPITQTATGCFLNACLAIYRR